MSPSFVVYLVLGRLISTEGPFWARAKLWKSEYAKVQPRASQLALGGFFDGTQPFAYEGTQTPNGGQDVGCDACYNPEPGKKYCMIDGPNYFGETETATGTE